MPTSWSKFVCVELLGKAPYLADLFIRIPIHNNSISDRLTLSIQKGHPVFYPPSDPDPSPALLAKAQHHLLHLMLDHPHLTASFSHDRAWHLALDNMVNQHIPPQLRQDDPALSIPPGFPAGSSLFQAWNWWSQQDPEEYPHLLTAIAEHQLWTGTPGQEVDTIIQSSLKTQSFPEHILQLREETFALLEGLSWQQRLIQISGSSASTRLSWTSRKASRRYGTHPGIRIRSRGSLVVILDTSGSMSPSDLNAIFTFLPEMQQYYRQIHIVESDHQVRRSYPYQGQPPERIEGRGDTFFQPALDYVQQHFQCDAIWYVTDGRGTAPRVKSPVPLSWILCGDRPALDEMDSFPGILIPVNIPPTPGVLLS